MYHKSTLQKSPTLGPSEHTLPFSGSSVIVVFGPSCNEIPFVKFMEEEEEEDKEDGNLEGINARECSSLSSNI